MLDTTDLAHTVSHLSSAQLKVLTKYQGDQGSSVTSFVTEYRYKSAKQTSDFLVEAEYLKLDEIGDHLKELLWSYRQPYALKPGEDISAEEYKALETESQVAWDTLNAAFGDKAGFDESWLKDFSSGAFDQVLSKLRSWASSMEWPSGAEGGVWRVPALTAEECSELTDKFMKDRLWPFTKIMRYFDPDQTSYLDPEAD